MALGRFRPWTRTGFVNETVARGSAFALTATELVGSCTLMSGATDTLPSDAIRRPERPSEPFSREQRRYQVNRQRAHGSYAPQPGRPAGKAVAAVTWQ